MSNKNEIGRKISLAGTTHKIDTHGPKRELEKAEKQLEMLKRETQKNFEREKKIMENKLEKRRHSSVSSGGSLEQNSRKSSVGFGSSVEPGPSRKISAGFGSTVDQTVGMGQSVTSQAEPMGMRSRKSSRDMESPYQYDVGAVTLKQLRFLHDIVITMLHESEIQGQDPQNPKYGRTSVTWRNDSRDNEATPFTPGLRSRKSSNPVDPLIGGEPSSTETGVRMRKGISQDHGRGYTFDDSPSILMSGMNTPSMEETFLHTPSQAVELISMTRVLCVGRTLDTKVIKGLTSVLEECRFAVKAIKGGVDPERAQEKLIKRLNELLDQVKPLGNDLLITPAEILRCSYLRLSPENIETMEKMMLDQGLNPGIHSHSKVTEMTLEQLMELDQGPAGAVSWKQQTSTEVAHFQPTSVYQTKAGSSYDKRRTSKPETANLP